MSKRSPKKRPTRGQYEEKKAEPTGNCSICIDDLKEPASLDSCSHSFCFECITEWAKTMNTCPLCRERFHKINCKTKRVVKVRNRNIEPSAFASNFVPSAEDFTLHRQFLDDFSGFNIFRVIFGNGFLAPRTTQRSSRIVIDEEPIDLTLDDVPPPRAVPLPSRSTGVIDLEDDDDVVEVEEGPIVLN
jgi:hypothetical protein